jgi:hypothetical protein
MTYFVGKDLNGGTKEHAVPAGADTAPSSPRSVRHVGYKAVYKALCGLVVWKPHDRDTYQDLPWTADPVGSCRTCVRLADASAEREGTAAPEGQAPGAR